MVVFLFTQLSLHSSFLIYFIYFFFLPPTELWRMMREMRNKKKIKSHQSNACKNCKFILAKKKSERKEKRRINQYANITLPLFNMPRRSHKMFTNKMFVTFYMNSIYRPLYVLFIFFTDFSKLCSYSRMAFFLLG